MLFLILIDVQYLQNVVFTLPQVPTTRQKSPPHQEDYQKALKSLFFLLNPVPFNGQD